MTIWCLMWEEGWWYQLLPLPSSLLQQWLSSLGVIAHETVMYMIPALLACNRCYKHLELVDKNQAKSSDEKGVALLLGQGCHNLLNGWKEESLLWFVLSFLSQNQHWCFDVNHCIHVILPFIKLLNVVTIHSRKERRYGHVRRDHNDKFVDWCRLKNVLIML